MVVTKSLFFTCIGKLTMYEFTTAMEFQKERNVFIREHMNHMYGTKLYYLSKLTLEFPLLVALPIMECALTFHGIEYREGAFFDFILVYFLTTQCGTAMGYLISCVFSNMIVAAVMTVYFAIPSILFGGLLRNMGEVPGWISWFQYCSPTRYGFEALLWAQWPEDEYGMIKLLHFDLGYWRCCIMLAIIAVFLRLITLVFFSRLTKNAL